MHIIAPTLDDLLNESISKLVDVPSNISATRGNTSEIFGVLLELENPRARLSRTETRGVPFSALGELLWYLSKKHDLSFITHYLPNYSEESEDNKTIYGGYGPRLFNFRGKYNQISNIIDLLKRKPYSRRAVIQIFDAEDISQNHKEIPCTCVMQFIIRDYKLHMLTFMRSNDVFIGLPHDIFSFTMIQELVACSLNLDLGTYKHSVGSLHLYEEKKKQALQYINEGFQPTTITMPEMPKNDPWTNVEKLLRIEEKIRTNQKVNFSDFDLEPYWADLAYLLQIHTFFKSNDFKSIENSQKNLSNSIYNTYIEKRLAKRK